MNVPSPDRETGGRNWSSRSIGAAWQHRFFYLLIRCGGRGIAYLALRFVVAYYVLFRPDQRRKSEYYLRRRFPGAAGAELLRHSYRMSYALGQSLIDRAVVGILGTGSTAVTLHGRDELLALLNEGQGLILLTAHAGCWQAAMSALGYLDRTVHLLMQREDGDLDRHYFEHRGEQSPFRIIDPRGDFGGALEMVGALKRGEVLSIMGDRMLGHDRNGVRVPFLGADVLLPVSPYKIASATGAPIAVLLSAKTGYAGYRLDLAATIRVPSGLGRSIEAFAPYARQLTATLERFVAEYPYQFFNFHDMWEVGER